MPKRGAYARRSTEVKVHQASERKDTCRYSNTPTDGTRWVSQKGKLAPINGKPAPSLRHQLARECVRFHAAEERKSIIVNGIVTGKITVPNETLLLHARAIVEAAKARLLL